MPRKRQRQASGWRTGRSGKYLEPPAGRFSAKITELAREGLRFTLLSALRRMREKKNEPIVEHDLRVKTATSSAST